PFTIVMLYMSCLLVQCDACLRDLHSFPTRRSSDLGGDSAPLDPTERKTGDERPVGRLAKPMAISTEERRIVTVLFADMAGSTALDRKSTRLNSSHEWISYAVFCLKKKKPSEDHINI